ncbi:hypothetical protein DFR72_104503 [Lentzea flaviverrucosa]|uniref:Transmembrane protein n=2 Tax=Lentzea flaviverrucosa TaxID=200379 RepID=A0A1H9LW52_9PSEU|nr:hypothetical protein DFR72_104503 [Lentzea flaviverrucosa]SER15671.1 hypothetical protein SAMN05216195_104123 [Lentzea flaviverrucosa]
MLVAAMVGALCGAGWFSSVQSAFDLPCDGTGLSCTFFVLLCVAPALLVLWVVAAWGLLRLARYSPAWPTVLAGTSFAIVLAFALGSAMPLLSPPRWFVFVLVPFSAAVGYALAAKVAGNHRGQGETPVA